MVNENNIIVAGDPHGRFEQIVDTIKTFGSKHVIILGDLECPQPLDEMIPRELGAEVWYIRGNHECENKMMWDNIINSSYGQNDLSGRVVEMDGVKVSGLSGVFEVEIWRPPYAENYTNLEEWKISNANDKWFEHKLFKHESGTIFPDTYYSTAELRADVLITHEAPDCHPYGFSEINELAQFMGAKKVFHGHHHDNLDYSSQYDRLNFEAHGVGLAGIKNINGKELVPGVFDLHRNELRTRKMRA